MDRKRMNWKRMRKAWASNAGDILGLLSLASLVWFVFATLGARSVDVPSLVVTLICVHLHGKYE